MKHAHIHAQSACTNKQHAVNSKEGRGTNLMEGAAMESAAMEGIAMEGAAIEGAAMEGAAIEGAAKEGGEIVTLF